MFHLLILFYNLYLAQFYKRMHPEIAYKIIRFQRDRSLKPSVSKLAKALIGFRSAINILAGYRNFGKFI